MDPGLNKKDLSNFILERHHLPGPRKARGNVGIKNMCMEGRTSTLSAGPTVSNGATSKQARESLQAVPTNKKIAE